MIRPPPGTTQSRSSAASDVYKRQVRPLALGFVGRFLSRGRYHCVCESEADARENGIGKAAALVVEYVDRFIFAPTGDVHRNRFSGGHGTCLLYTSPSPRDY